MTDARASGDLEKGNRRAHFSAESKHHHRRKLHLHRRKREADRIHKKLPGLLHTGDHDLAKLRKRLVIKNEVVAAIAEFCGTFLFLLFSFGIATQAGQQQLSQSSSSSIEQSGSARLDTSQLLYSSLGFGFSLAVNAWVFFRVSGGLFNPAVTLGLYLSGALTWYRAIVLTVVQFVSAIAAAGIAQLITPGGINARTKLGSSTTLAQGFFVEMFSTALLMFSIYMLAGEKHKATFLAPVGIGLALFLAELFATGLTGGSLNPARTLGPDVIAGKFDETTWIYYIAPCVGTILSAGVYWLLKTSRYETANEGQDGDDTAQLIRDREGNLMGVMETVAMSEAPEIPALQEHQDRPASSAGQTPSIHTGPITPQAEYSDPIQLLTAEAGPHPDAEPSAMLGGESGLGHQQHDAVESPTK